jgi:putative FmdB family regulatory protein
VDFEAPTKEDAAMPVYEYRCEECNDIFELRRPAAESSAATLCPEGHSGARRVLSVFSSPGRSQTGMAMASGASGGCGPGCACAAAQ